MTAVTIFAKIVEQFRNKRLILYVVFLTPAIILWVVKKAIKMAVTFINLITYIT